MTERTFALEVKQFAQAVVRTVLIVRDRRHIEISFAVSCFVGGEFNQHKLELAGKYTTYAMVGGIYAFVVLLITWLAYKTLFGKSPQKKAVSEFMKKLPASDPLHQV